MACVRRQEVRPTTRICCTTMGSTAFHAGSTGSNPVRGTTDHSVDSGVLWDEPRDATPTVSPTRRGNSLQAHDPIERRLLTAALLVLAVISLGFFVDETSAHTIQPSDCSAIARAVDGSLATKRAAALGCTHYRARHASAHQLAACGTRPACIIRFVFGPTYGDQAVSVAYCESTLRTTAANGQYLGLFQMGSSERATYGHGPDALTQSRAAHRYFLASGSDWSPWECKP